MTALPIADAAAELEISTGTLQRWVSAGAPVARRGGRGRGRCTLVDPEAIAAWKRSEGGEDALRTFAAELPELLAEVIFDTFRMVESAHKRDVAGVMAAVWYTTTTRLLDRIDGGEVSVVPEKIERLRGIFETSGKVVPRFNEPAEDNQWTR